MAISQKLHTKLVQKLILTPSLQQAIKLLPMSTLELRDLLTQEMVENPMLEELPVEDTQVAEAQTTEEKPEAKPEAQKAAVLARDLNECIRLGGNIYFLAKIGSTDGRSFQQMAGSMTGMTEQEYRDMMIAGGRSPEGNRRLGEDGDAQPHRQPQGAAGRKQD